MAWPHSNWSVFDESCVNRWVLLSQEELLRLQPYPDEAPAWARLSRSGSLVEKQYLDEQGLVLFRLCSGGLTGWMGLALESELLGMTEAEALEALVIDGLATL